MWRFGTLPSLILKMDKRAAGRAKEDMDPSIIRPMVGAISMWSLYRAPMSTLNFIIWSHYADNRQMDK